MTTSITPSPDRLSRALPARRSWRGLALGLALSLVTAFGTSSAGLAAGTDGYVLQKGDKLSLSVVGATEFQQTLAIDIDGSILVPLGGPIPAAGHTLADVTAAVRAALAQSSYTVVSGNGEFVTSQILPASVTLSIAEYRPVYVDGDVQAPGAFAYEPGLTARRAIALAGGYGLARLRGSDPMPQLLTLQGDLRRLTNESAAAGARLERVKAQLAADQANPAGPVADATATDTTAGTTAAADTVAAEDSGPASASIIKKTLP